MALLSRRASAAWSRLACGVLLAAVAGASLASVEASQVALNWQDNANNESGYKIERSTNGVAYAQVAVVGVNVTSFSDTTCVTGTPYWFRVRAYNAAGSSPYSNIANLGSTGPINTTPTISNVTDRSSPEDVTTSAIAFVVGDNQTAAGSLTVSASSSQATLVPSSGLVLGGSGANRTLTVAPAANQSGNATITLTVSDGTLLATDTFVFTVTAVNDAPAISNIADRTINTGTSTGAMAFSVADVETTAGSLTVSGRSSNATLVPAGGISFAGSGAIRTMTVTPATGQSGSATITVTISDGALTASDTFALLVSSVNAAPTISDVANRSTPEDAGTGPIAFIVGDTQTAVGSLAVTAVSSNQILVPDAALLLGGSGANRTLAVSPAANQSGSATITITVSDGALMATDTFMLTVTAANDAPTISHLADRTIAVNTGTGAIAFTVSDVESSAALVVTASSSNPALVPGGNVVLAGSAAARSLNITPLSNQGGTTTITLTVSDGQLTTQDTFLLTVGDDGWVTARAGEGFRNTALGATQSGAFTITFDATAATTPLDAVIGLAAISPAGYQDLGVAVRFNAAGALDARKGSAFAADVNVPYAAGVTYHFRVAVNVPAHTYSAYVTPGNGAEVRLASNYAFRSEQSAVTGLAFWSVCVAPTSVNRMLTVGAFTLAPTNTAPTMSDLANRSLAEDTTTGALAFTVGDTETAAGSLTVTGSSSNPALVPNAAIVFGGSGASRNVSVTPAASQSGAATISVTVSDGVLTATDTFVVTVTAVNDGPTTSSIADRAINSGTSTEAIAFSVDDVETAAGSLTVSGNSSNATLVPASGITFGGSGASRTVTVTPAAGQSGTATITVTVSDGALAANAAFVLTVNVVNTAPTIGDIANQSINQDATTAALEFTVGDTQTAAGSLTVTATSSNPTLVPASSLVLGGAGANRTISVKPAASQSGTATITVTVSDGALMATDTFVLTVVAVNRSPTISAISNKTIERGGTTGVIAFTVGDVETPAGSLMVTASSSNPALVPAAGIMLGGSGANRTITVTPVAWQSGTVTITVSASDGANTTSRAFALAVTFASQIVIGTDIGSPALAGATTSANGIFTIRAGGSDIWGARDQLHFARQQMLGDAELTVRVSSLVQTHVWTKVGLMFRAGLTEDAAHVSVFVTPARGVVLQWRSAKGGPTTGCTALPGTAPEWLRLVRTGDTFYAFRSENGVAWEMVEFVSVDLPEVAFGGMAVSAISTQALTTATFDKFKVD